MEILRINEEIVENLLNETGFGWFNWKIYIITALVLMNTAIGLGTNGLILPSAVCDFELSSVTQSYMAAVQLLGLLIGQCFWFIFAEIKGRKIPLTTSIFLQGFADLTASLISNYYGFLCCKFFTGIASSGQLTLAYTYFSEFQPLKYRNKLLTSLEVPWAVGLIVAAGIGWAVIPLEIDLGFNSKYFIFNSWNLYLLICSLFSPIIALWLIFFSETPKYLAETSQNKRLMALLNQMYQENTGNSNQNFTEKLKQLENKTINELLTNSEDETAKHIIFSKMIQQYWHQVASLFKPQFLKMTLIGVIIAYSVMFSYYAMLIWHGEVFERFATFEEQFPNTTASICTISRQVLSLLNNESKADCESDLHSASYTHNIILASGLIPLTLLATFSVHKFGLKWCLITYCIAGGIFGASFLLVNNSTENFIVFSFSELLASISIVLIISVTIENYPTHLRISATFFINLCGRLGALVGSFLVGHLINHYCYSLILIIAGHLLAAGFLSIFIPNMIKSDPANEKKLSGVI
ncbi:synaptic vesicle glycoprotein 2A-like isoform X1 [Cotesia glomerata]|nr:synaptic vesicle glycoprotein 2A-like isoform X1 [Cotesia glomerata]